ncbi:hypothetical protein [Aquimonas voraii]|uniref:Uncharacterized protein n=1 Tax=Aquimonas voraii TaxID=265719 RepID=A0A1G6UY49_9GAMM|nr:hypothetical protein [Aquimonas voraii]SDD46299.1 hypothetical protein SAMN04488509_102553 [Aquimonas voraii]
MATFRRITKRDNPARIASLAVRYEALLVNALEIAVELASNKPQLVREILATATAEGLAANLNSKTAAVSYRAEKYRRTWHTLIPWHHLDGTTAEQQAESMIETVETNVYMTETNSWPPLPSDPPSRKGSE